MRTNMVVIQLTERVADLNRLITTGPDRDQGYRAAGKLFELGQVGFGRCRQVRHTGCRTDVALPTIKLLINRLTVMQDVSVAREFFQKLPLVRIGRANLDAVEFVQNIEFGDRQSGQPIEAY